jgi:hypothetical protein
MRLSPPLTMTVWTRRMEGDSLVRPSPIEQGESSLWILYIGKCYRITPAIMLVTATLIVLALATLGDATQIGLFLCMSLHQGKYNMFCCRRHYCRHYHINFRQWKYDLRCLNSSIFCCIRAQALAKFLCINAHKGSHTLAEFVVKNIIDIVLLHTIPTHPNLPYLPRVV